MQSPNFAQCSDIFSSNLFLKTFCVKPAFGVVRAKSRIPWLVRAAACGDDVSAVNNVSKREHSAETSLAADAVKLKVQGPRSK